MAKKTPDKTPDLADYQHSAALKSGKGFDLKRFDPAAKPFGSGDKARDKEATAALALELDALQNLFYADHRFKLLVVLQGTALASKVAVALQPSFLFLAPIRQSAKSALLSFQT